MLTFTAVWKAANYVIPECKKSLVTGQIGPKQNQPQVKSYNIMLNMYFSTKIRISKAIEYILFSSGYIYLSVMCIKPLPISNVHNSCITFITCGRSECFFIL